MPRAQSDETPTERELAPVTHGIHIVVCRKIRTRMEKKRATLPQKFTSFAATKGPRAGGKANWKWALTAVIAQVSRANVEERISVSESLVNRVSALICSEAGCGGRKAEKTFSSLTSSRSWRENVFFIKQRSGQLTVVFRGKNASDDADIPLCSDPSTTGAASRPNIASLRPNQESLR
jgi:hypothetical protein